MRSRPVGGSISRFTARASRIRMYARSHRRRYGGLVAIAAITALVFTACNPGAVTSVAGNGTAGNSGDGGKATDASFEQPGGLAVLPDGSYDVVDQGACVIRHVSTDGTISTIAGTGTCGYSGDGGPATAAQIKPAFTGFEAPSGQLAVDASGNLYLADSGNGRIRRIATDGTITTLAGDGTTSIFVGCAGSEVLAGSLAFAPNGTLYVQCPNGVFQLMPDGSLQSVISDIVVSMTVDTAGDIYYADNDGVVHKRTPDGTVTTFAQVPALLQPQQSMVGVTGLSVGPDGSVYAALGPTQLVTGYAVDNVPLFGAFNYNAVLRLGQGTATVIAGTNGPDPGTGTQSGYGTQLAITPYGIAATAKNALLVSSGHDVYTLQDANLAQPWSGTSCDPALVKPGYDLSNVDLSGQNFYRCNLTGVNLSNANLSRANLKQTILDDANLSGTNLSGATLDGAHGVGIIGTPVNLPAGWYVTAGLLVPPNRDLSGLDLSGRTLTGADLAGANLTNTKLNNTNFTGADLSGANLTGSIGANTNFTNANLSKVVVSSTTSLTGPTFTGANLTGTDLSSLTASDFNGVTSGGIIGTPQLPTGVQLINGFLVTSSANLAGADLHGVDFSGIDLTGVNFTGADLHGANFTGANLAGTNVTNANFSGANLKSATLSSATVTNTNFDHANAASVVATSLKGIPANAPSGVQFRTDATATHGAFLYPGVNLAGNPSEFIPGAFLDGVDLSGLDLTGADLSYALARNTNVDNTNLTNVNLTGANFVGATGTPVGADKATYSFTTCPDSAVVSSPATCLGHGFGAAQTSTNITGTVTDGNGQPLGGVTVKWYRNGQYSTPEGSTTTASDGTYTIANIGNVGLVYVHFALPGCLAQWWNHESTARLADGISLTAGQTTTGIDATLSPSTTNCIAGTITDPNGAPIAGATVTVTNFFSLFEAGATTAADGTYTVTDLAPGASRIQFSAPGFVTQYWNNEPDAAHSDTIDVPSGGIATANATLVPSSG